MTKETTRGNVGCSYESDPWSGLGYTLHHSGYGDCILSTDGKEFCVGGVVFDTPEDALTAISKI